MTSLFYGNDSKDKSTLLNISKKFILNNYIVHKYRYKINIKIIFKLDIVKNMNI